MNQTYTFNYLKIYLWQGISIVLNLLSMFVVIPRLTDNPTIYGIYVVCISANIFLTYGDIGFVSAGYKYASECYVQKKLEEEVKIVAFVAFVLFMLVVLFAPIISFIALNPQVLIKNISTATDIKIASRLFFILALFSPVIIFQRVVNIIYSIRLEQFVIQKAMIGASILKILSIFYFFQEDHYDIISYFLFCQLATLVALLACFIIARKRYGYDFVLFLKAFKFSKSIFDKTKSLAFGSFFGTLMWIMYYELDAFAISRLLGVESVAIYAAGFTIQSFLRTLFGALYNPFLARFNHYKGLSDIDGLRKLHARIITLTIPFVIFPILSMVLLMDPLIYSWIGEFYQKSIVIAQLLILCVIYAFITYPASFLIIAQEKILLIYLTSAIPPLIYWLGIILTLNFLGLFSFALFKFIAMSIGGMISLGITLKFLDMSINKFFKKFLGPTVIPLGFLIVYLLYLNQHMPHEKNSLNLLIVVTAGGSASFGALLLYYFLSDHFRNYTQDLIRKCFNGFKKQKKKFF